MKKFIMFIYSWIVSIFKDNYIIPISSGEEKEEENPPKIFRSRQPRMASHNNRKPTKGRARVQTVFCGDGEVRTIFHQG